jgi:uncharacterized protein (DUF885 family)
LQLSKVLDNYWTEHYDFDPFGATSQGLRQYNDTLPNDNTQAYIAQYKAFNEKYLSLVSAFDFESLSENDKISVELLKDQLQFNVDAIRLRGELMPIQQFWGTHLSFVQMGSGQSDQPFANTEDYDNFLSRIDDFTVWADSAIANMNTGIAKGYVLPKALVLKVIPQIDDLVAKDPTKSIFYGPVANMPKDFSTEQKLKYKQQYAAAIQDKLNPCFAKLGSYFSKTYLPKARPSSGIDALPEGKMAYEMWTKYWTTTSMTPDQIHQLGLKEVARIRTEMEAIKTQVGYKGTMKDFFTYVVEDAKFRTFKQPKDVINGYDKIYKTMEPNLKKAFTLVPKSKFEVRQTEAFRAASASAEYKQGSPDGTRPGIFYVPILDATKFPSPGMESLFLHEAIPGHHYQSSLQMENQDLPKFRRFNWIGSYGEGWALYCESLGKEMGLYTDPYQYFGALGDEIHRAIRLVVDTGIHTKGWSREKAIQYSLDNEPTSLEGAVAEIERYMAVPGQALSYKIGALKIRELRTKYENQLGSRFNLADFHNEVLKDGCVSLSVLESKMDRWAAQK